MPLSLGIDLGTTVTKAALFSEDGRLRGLGRVARDKRQDREEVCELPVETFWSLLGQAVREAMATADAEPDNVRAVSYASQANSFVLLDDSGHCLTPLVLWPDLRAKSLGDNAVDLWAQEDFLTTTGVGLGGRGFCPYKLDWFRRRSSLWQRTHYIQTISDLLVYGLTGERSGDASTVSMTGLWDQRRARWRPDALRELGIAPSMMSHPQPPGSVLGALTPEGARRLGLSPGIPVVAGALDHYAAAVGAGLGSLADVCESTGTVLACIALTDRYDPRPGRCVGPTRSATQYYNLAFNDTGAANTDWYREQFAPGLPIQTLLRLAEDVPPGAMGLRAKPTLQALSQDECFLNLTDRHAHGHCVRAIMEASAIALRDLIAGLGLPEKPARVLATGGGARSDVWLGIKADLLGMDVLQVDCEEPACQGAAMLAAIASGQVAGFSAASQAFHRIRRRLQPDAERHAAYLIEFGSESVSSDAGEAR